ncbi:MoaB/Mog domain-containing protein [Peziza echinospora]|nr:MoaB/Mog domain-containing protein [Peziza echinospora]
MASVNIPTETARLYRTAACLIIGDEVLNGKTVDKNSPFFAQYCFNLGIALNRIETIPDDKPTIAEAVVRMSKNYDFVVTSGGIGPTHDDITYSSIAEGFGLPLKRHEPTVEKMKHISKTRPRKALEEEQDWETPSKQLTARLRMATFPEGEGVSVEFVDESLWVPIVIVNRNVHILPGIPTLFTQLLNAYKPRLLSRGLAKPDDEQIHRIIISTPLAESQVADYLTELQEKVDGRGVKVGSYPRWGKSTNTITLVGKDLEYLESLVGEVEREVKGRRVQVEGEDDEQQEEGVEGKSNL